MAKILIVDDSPTETYKLTNILEKNAHSVLSAETGEQGVSLAKTEQPDVVLMDIVMPGLNGFQATRQLSRSNDTKHIPVIIVTAKNQVASRTPALIQPNLSCDPQAEVCYFVSLLTNGSLPRINSKK